MNKKFSPVSFNILAFRLRHSIHLPNHTDAFLRFAIRSTSSFTSRCRSIHHPRSVGFDRLSRRECSGLPLSQVDYLVGLRDLCSWICNQCSVSHSGYAHRWSMRGGYWRRSVPFSCWSLPVSPLCRFLGRRETVLMCIYAAAVRSRRNI